MPLKMTNRSEENCFLSRMISGANMQQLKDKFVLVSGIEFTFIMRAFVQAEWLHGRGEKMRPGKLFSCLVKSSNEAFVLN